MVLARRLRLRLRRGVSEDMEDTVEERPLFGDNPGLNGCPMAGRDSEDLRTGRGRDKNPSRERSSTDERVDRDAGGSFGDDGADWIISGSLGVCGIA